MQKPSIDNTMTPEEVSDAMLNVAQLIFAYAFFDKKGKTFDTPFFCRDNNFAKRHYEIVCKDNPMLKNFREDYDLYLIGSYNLITGDFVNQKTLILKGVVNNA